MVNKKADSRCYAQVGSMALVLYVGGICGARTHGLLLAEQTLLPSELISLKFKNRLPSRAVGSWLCLANTKIKSKHLSIQIECHSININHLSRLILLIDICLSFLQRLQKRYKSPSPRTSSYLPRIFPQ